MISLQLQVLRMNDLHPLSFVPSFSSMTSAVPSSFPGDTGRIRLIVAVVGFGETGRICSPINAFENDDFPALNAPKSATVNSCPSNRSAFSLKYSAISIKPGTSLTISATRAAFWAMFSACRMNQ